MRRATRLALLTLGPGLVCLAPSPARAQDWDAVEIRVEAVAGNVSMITGGGGNIGVLVAGGGVLVVDDQYAPLGDRILAALRELAPGPVRYVVNTHFHQDHTGGNEVMARAGALLVAHENVRHRLATAQVVERWGSEPLAFEAAPDSGLPVLTFEDALTFHVDGEVVRVVHVPHAHTDGDALVFFEDANVVHMGDVFWSGTYPFIDVSSGGTVDGFIAAQGRALALMDADTRVIPGHGPVAGRAQLRKKRDALRAIRDRIARSKAAGRSVEEVVAERPTRDFDARLGGGFISPESLVHAIYESLPPSRR